MKQTRLTTHALMRLSERTSITPQSLKKILDGEKYIFLGKERDNNRFSKLFFSKSDDHFYIAIQDAEDGDVVTILTLEYWHNLSEKYFDRKLVVTRQNLLEAIRIGDPENKILAHPPLTNQKVVRFSILALDENDLFKPPRMVNVGAISANLFYGTPTEDLANMIKSKFTEKLNDKNISEKEVILIRWGAGGDLQNNEIEAPQLIEYSSLVDAVKNDLYLRNNLFKKYDDFLEILNRQKKVVGRQDI